MIFIGVDVVYGIEIFGVDVLNVIGNIVLDLVGWILFCVVNIFEEFLVVRVGFFFCSIFVVGSKIYFVVVFGEKWSVFVEFGIYFVLYGNMDIWCVCYIFCI